MVEIRNDDSRFKKRKKKSKLYTAQMVPFMEICSQTLVEQINKELKGQRSGTVEMKG